jgi:hypothetical protein
MAMYPADMAAKKKAKKTAPARKSGVLPKKKKKAPKGPLAATPGAARPPAAPTRFTAAGNAYLPRMYKDRYYPDALVDKVRTQLEELVAFLEKGTPAPDAIQVRCDAFTDAVNGLEGEFDDAGSELETVAREDIAETVAKIFDTYGVTLDPEEALRNREW